MVFVAMATMMRTLDAAGLIAKPADKVDDDYAPLDFSHIDPVDLCLFVCHSCFQQVSFKLPSLFFFFFFVSFWSLEDLGITTLTLWGRVTSSVT